VKFSILLEQRLKKILLLSLSTAVIGLAVYGIVWNLHTRERSKEFILSHLNEVIIAQVNSQNTFNIDGELNRIVNSWSKTQEFPLRVDVYLDGKHWAHGGPMKAFGVLYASESHLESLSSGQKLAFDISMDLSGPIFRFFIVLSIFIGFFVAVYFSLKKGLSTAIEEISKPLEERISNLSVASENLSNHAKNGFLTNDSHILELQKLDQSLYTLFTRISLLESEISEKKYSEGQFQMARQVTHALSGAMSSLSLYIDQAKSMDTMDKKFLKSISEQIKSVSSDLMGSKNKITSELSKEEFNLKDSLKNIVEQKTQELQRYSHKEITLHLFDSIEDNLIVTASKAKFERALINLITNSIEAISGKGIIDVIIFEKDGFATVTVRDTGCGIPEEILPQLMNEGATFGKENGNGLGLYHTKLIIEEEFSGKLRIASLPGQGTRVNFKVPVKKNQSKKEDIVLFNNQEFIIVDDDKLIHQAWDIKLASLANKIKVIHIYSVDEFEKWFLKNNKSTFSSRLFIFDYDLKGSMSGLDLIAHHQLMFESVLVTGMAKENKIIEEVKKLKVKIIPKDELANLKISLVENDFSPNDTHLLEVT